MSSLVLCNLKRKGGKKNCKQGCPLRSMWLQVAHALSELQNGDVDKVMAALEVLARLAWSDDEVTS